MRIAFLQLWLGKIPDYFWYHYETTKNLQNIDFYFFTDQEIKLDALNYRVIKTTKEEVESTITFKLNKQIRIKNNKKICDLKASLGDIFYDHIKDYDYFGVYDIDTLFGDIRKYVNPFLGEYDFISIGDPIYYNRLSGPFILMRNCQEIRELYKVGDLFSECFESEIVECFEETVINNYALNNYKTKLIYSSNVETYNGGKVTFGALWTAGKVFVKNEEKIIHHFYYKDKTVFNKLGNIISCSYKKELIDDFYWVVHFSKNYEKLIPYLIDSLQRYSNRKCILYTINYMPDFAFKLQFESSQFIFRMIEISEEKKDGSGRSVEIMNSKPLILLDAIEHFPDKKFVHIDSDIFLTVNADRISHFFEKLLDYPLVNSHLHEVVYLSNILPNENWTDCLQILMNDLNINNSKVKPRRKCNVIVFDERSSWFFKEQMIIYDKYRDDNKPGILAIFDEDSTNALLSKYELHDCLPIIDIEDSFETNIEKYTDLNHPFHATGISEYAKLPKSENDILFFHNFKQEDEYKKLSTDYTKRVLDCDEIIITYHNNLLLFEKITFLNNKLIESEVDFLVEDKFGNEMSRLMNQQLFNYRVFYIDNFYLVSGIYQVKIIESKSKRQIYFNAFNV